VDGRFFYPVGVNYWPRDTAVYQWKEYDKTAIEREFGLMKSLGINCIRFFIMWDDLLKAKDTIDGDFFPKFEHLHETARTHDIKLVPTLFIGHMSGQDWFPSWFLVSDEDARRGVPFQEIGLPPRRKFRGKVRDIYLDEDVYRNAFLQIEALLSRYKISSTIISWDLSNENQYMMRPLRPQDGFVYMKRLYEKIKEVDPGHPVTLGMGKFSENSGFHSYDEWSIAKYNDYYSVHSYPRFYYPPTLRYIDFYKTYKPVFDMRISMASGIPVQQQEFGLSDSAFPGKRRSSREALLGGYYRTVLWGCLLNGARCGCLGWCFADFSRLLEKRDPYSHKKHELRFGVVSSSYQPKASGLAIQQFSAFINKVNVEHFVEEPSRVAIVLPWNYLDKKDVNQSLSELMDDNPMKKDRRKRFLVDNWLSQNKALFSAYIFCRMAGVQPDFVPSGASLEKYRLVLLPDLKGITTGGWNVLEDLVNAGGFVYISSNGYLPEKLMAAHATGPTITRARRLDLEARAAPGIHAAVKAAFASLAGFSIAGVRTRAPVPDNVSVIYADKANHEPVACFVPAASPGKGGFVVMTTSPEINHSSIRNAYKTESMHLFYSALFGLAGIEVPLICTSKVIECGQLVNRKTSERLLIAINHVLEPQDATIGLRQPARSVTDCQQLPFKSCGNEISFRLDGYGCRAFLVQ
nr:cellulase family glycosylhydrolase [Candidatus Sigynarchaeota archaeon]